MFREYTCDIRCVTNIDYWSLRNLRAYHLQFLDENGSQYGYGHQLCWRFLKDSTNFAGWCRSESRMLALLNNHFSKGIRNKEWVINIE